MKKRVKLFTTIASLCLAVALMAFGVYAATTVTVSVTNKVNYTATPNVKAIVWHTVAKNEETGYADGKAPNTKSVATSTEESSQEYPDLTFIGANSESTGTIAIGDIELTNVNGQAGVMQYSYTIYIKNTIPSTDSNPYLKVVVTPPAAKEYATGSYGIATTYKVGETAKTATTVLNTNEVLAYTVTLQVDNARSLPTGDDTVNLASSFVLTAQATNA